MVDYCWIVCFELASIRIMDRHFVIRRFAQGDLVWRYMIGMNIDRLLQIIRWMSSEVVIVNEQYGADYFILDRRCFKSF